LAAAAKRRAILTTLTELERSQGRDGDGLGQYARRTASASTIRSSARTSAIAVPAAVGAEFRTRMLRSRSWAASRMTWDTPLTRSKRGRRCCDPSCASRTGSCKHSQCCESTAEEPGVGNPHAGFCGNGGRATSRDPVGEEQSSLSNRDLVAHWQHPIAIVRCPSTPVGAAVSPVAPQPSFRPDSMRRAELPMPNEMALPRISLSPAPASTSCPFRGTSPSRW